MQTVIETPACIAAAKDAGMTADEMTAVVDTIAQNVEAGEIVPGCGGARKLCVAKPGKGKSGKGKSGGYRVITYYAGDVFPVFLPTVFGKNEKASLPQSERNALAGLTKRLTDTRKRLGSAFHRGAWCARRRARKENDVTKAFDKIAAGLEDAIAYAGECKQRFAFARGGHSR